MRDTGPIIVRDEEGRRVGVHFRFNAYGERFVPYDNDAEIGARVLAHLEIPVRRSPLILEGGSITVDGEGTLITTEQCLLNANRNPGWTRNEIEHELCEQLGVEKIIWLRWGRLEDRHTDGHVDVVCMFVRPGVVIAQGCDDPANPNYERMQSNLKTLRAASDARGRPLQVIELPLLPLVQVCGENVLVGNTNFYFANGGMVVPVADESTGDGVLHLFRRACPEHNVVAVQARMIGFGGGGIHCITQQIPAGT
jgi:agmatine deiminase